MALLRSIKSFIFDCIFNFLWLESKALENFVDFLNEEIVFLNVSGISQIIFKQKVNFIFQKVLFVFVLNEFIGLVIYYYYF